MLLFLEGIPRFHCTLPSLLGAQLRATILHNQIQDLISFLSFINRGVNFLARASSSLVHLMWVFNETYSRFKSRETSKRLGGGGGYFKDRFRISSKTNRKFPSSFYILLVLRNQKPEHRFLKIPTVQYKVNHKQNRKPSEGSAQYVPKWHRANSIALFLKCFLAELHARGRSPIAKEMW